jgi:hypothetical protein
MLENAGEISHPILDPLANMANSFDGAALSARWLCPIQSDSQRRGILQLTAAEYFDLVDKSARMTRSDKRGAIDADLAPILLRIGANPDARLETVTRFASKFCLAAGLLSNLRNIADQLGRRWLKGIAMARAAFASSRPQLARPHTCPAAIPLQIWCYLLTASTASGITSSSPCR